MRLFSHLRQKQVETANNAIARQDEFFGRYLASLDSEPQTSTTARTVTILARCPLSAVVRALIGRTADLQQRGVTARMLLARLEPDEALREAAEALSTLGAGQPIDQFLHWADNKCLLEAHEQLTLGPGMCWSGDMMRRDASKRDGLDLFEIDAPQTVRLGALAFDAIWAISSPVPVSRLNDRNIRPNAAYVRELGDAMPRPAVLQPTQALRPLRH